MGDLRGEGGIHGFVKIESNLSTLLQPKRESLVDPFAVGEEPVVVLGPL